MRLLRDDRDKFYLYTKVDGGYIKWYGGLGTKGQAFKITDTSETAKAFRFMGNVDPVLKYLKDNTDYDWQITTHREVNVHHPIEYCVDKSGRTWLPIEREFIKSEYHPLIEEQLPITSAWFSKARREQLIDTIENIIRCRDCNGWMYSKKKGSKQKKTCGPCLAIRREKRRRGR